MPLFFFMNFKLAGISYFRSGLFLLVSIIAVSMHKFIQTRQEKLLSDAAHSS